MLPTLREFVRQAWAEREPSHTWVILEEQRLHSRIADLALVRLDVAAVLQRLAGNWFRPLRLPEIRALHSLRPDRPATARLVASKMRTTQATAVEVLRGLVADGFVERPDSGIFLRAAPVNSLAERIVTIEAKREDPRKALQQARSHRPWTNETYVAFDAGFSKRFRARDTQWRKFGIGLVELEPGHWNRVIRARPHRRSNRLESALMGELALSRLLGVPDADRPERRLPHGKDLATPPDPLVLGSAKRWVDALRQFRPS